MYRRLFIAQTSSSRVAGSIIRHKATYESIEKAVGRQAATVFLDSMDVNSKTIDVPLISIADPSNMSEWQWATGLHCTPKIDLEELKQRCQYATDPFKLVEKDLSSLSGGIKELLGSDHPVLESCAKYFFEVDGGKKIRSTMVLAVSYALRSSSNNIQIDEIDKNNPVGSHELIASPSQKRLAEITEMIHTASLFHDDVIDKAETRRNVPSVNQVFGNKVAILGGDFLLSRASVSLARLRNLEVVELLSTVIEHLVKGEIMQIKPVTNGISGLEYYLRKNFYKTASLMGNSCLAAAVLGGCSDECKKASYMYGVHLGQAFQLVDDALDFEGTVATMGKESYADLRSGIATAPTLFAADEFPELLPMIARKFDQANDVEAALELVKKSDGLRRCRELAQVHTEMAIESISVLPPSPARDSLIALAFKVITRSS